MFILNPVSLVTGFVALVIAFLVLLFMGVPGDRVRVAFAAVAFFIAGGLNTICMFLAVYPFVGPLWTFSPVLSITFGVFIATSIASFLVEENDEQIFLAGLGTSAVIGIVWAIVTIILVAVFCWGNGNVAYYSKLGQISTAPLSNTSTGVSAIPPTDVNNIVSVPQDVAYYEGQQAVSAGGKNYGSNFQIDQKNLVIQTINAVGSDGQRHHHLYWIAPLTYNQWQATASGNPAPGYVSVDAEDPTKPAVLHTDHQLLYVGGNLLNMNNDLKRHLYEAGWTNYNLDDPTLEVTDDWYPYWTITLTTPANGAFGDTPNGLLTVDASTGAVKKYSMDEVPSWVDRVIPEDLAYTYIWDFAMYGNNPYWISGSHNQRKPSDDRPDSDHPSTMAVLYNTSDEPVYFEPLTSNTDSDTSSVGFVEYNLRSQSGTYYPYPQVNLSVENLFSKARQNLKGYSVETPQLYNLYGHLTWIAVYTQAVSVGSTYEAFGILDALHPNGDNVIMAANESDALDQYQSYLASVGSTGTGVSNTGPQTTTATETVARVSSQYTTTGTVYYLVFKGDKNVYTATAAVYPNLPLVQAGDSLKITYLAINQPQVPLSSIDDLTLDASMTGTNG